MAASIGIIILSCWYDTWAFTVIGSCYILNYNLHGRKCEHLCVDIMRDAVILICIYLGVVSKQWDKIQIYIYLITLHLIKLYNTKIGVVHF